MAQFLSRRWRQQPQYPALFDVGHPLARSIVVWVDARSIWVPSTQARSINTSRVSGSARGFVTGGSQYTFTSNPVSGAEWTTLGEVIAASSGGYQALWSFDNYGASSSLGVANSAYTTQNFGLDFKPYSPDSNSFQSFAVGAPVMCGGTVSVSAGQVKGYYNGRLNYSPTLASSASVSFDRVSLFNKRGGFDATSSNSRINWLALWSRALTEGEVAVLYENPWQLFAPQKSMMVFLPITFAYSRPIADLSNSGWVRVP